VIVGLHFVAEENWPAITARYYEIDLLDQPLLRFLDLIYGWVRENTDEEGWERFNTLLEAPLPGDAKRVSHISAEEEGRAFMTVMTMLQGGG
jgi:hypothetical protein